LTPAGRRYQVTTREQTLVDCLARLRQAGGPENVLRSVGGFRHIDAAGAIGIAWRASATTRARLGWVLEAKADQWRVAAEALDSLAGTLGGGPYYFAPFGKPCKPEWANRWRLYLPLPGQEMTAWLNQ
jgi:predicted transcriptional regulator of viral defense system